MSECRVCGIDFGPMIKSLMKPGNELPLKLFLQALSGPKKEYALLCGECKMPYYEFLYRNEYLEMKHSFLVQGFHGICPTCKGTGRKEAK